MKRLACALLLAALVVGAASTSRAEDPSSPDARLVAFERRIADLQQQLTTLQQELAVLRARPAPPTAKPLAWTRLVDEEHLAARLTAAAKERKPVVVFVQATWCTYCEAYKQLIEKDATLRQGFEGCVRLEIDVERGAREDLRQAAGLGDGQPLLTFFDATGEPVPDAALERWYGEGTARALAKSLETITR